ncbi:MAG: SPOR domain-containing protein [candidate division NC10 bacterium]|nr:SPOR domain-containing protein [candidate division NC10 bacterium]
MRRFNLASPPASGNPDEKAASEAVGGAPASRVRLLLLSLLLLVVVAIGIRYFIGTYLGRGINLSLPLPWRVGTPPVNDRPRPSPAPPPTPTAGLSPERPAEVSGLHKVPRSGSDVAAPPEQQAKHAGPQSPEPGGVRPLGVGAPETAKTVSRRRFSVQVGAMAHEANAHALRDRLEQLGYPSTIRKRRASISRQVVFVSAPGDENDAQVLTEKLRAEGFSAFVSESGGRYRVETGRLGLLDDAIDLARDLQKKGFTPTIAVETVSTTLYLVRVGTFSSRAKARQTSRELQKKGFPVLIAKEPAGGEAADPKRDVSGIRGGER